MRLNIDNIFVILLVVFVILLNLIIKWLNMIPLIKRYIADNQAGTAFDFSLALILYFNLVLILLDLMIIVAQWADLQRANGMMVDAIHNRVSPIVASGLDGTATDPTIFRNAYCNFTVLKLCNDALIFTYTNIDNTLPVIPSSSNNVFCVNTKSSSTINCSGVTKISNPLKNDAVHVVVGAIINPYRVTNFKYVTDSVFGDKIYATNIVTLGNF